MIKNNKGMKHIKSIFLIILIVSVVAVGLYFVQEQYKKAKIKTIRTNMSNIELKAIENINKQKADGDDVTYIGTQLSELEDNSIITELLENEVITEEELEKYYLLSDENLLTLGTGVSNEEGASYIINYETKEVIISKGCIINEKTLYKLSDIVNEDKTQD